MENQEVRDPSHSLGRMLVQLPDYRLAKNVHYPLAEILFVLIVANLCGYEALDLVRSFGKEKLAWLRRYFPYEHGIASADTFGRVLGRLDKAAFEQLFIHWVAQHFDLSPGELVNLDGKRLASSADRADQSKKRGEGGRYAEIIVNVFASGAGLVLAQRNVSEKMDEVQGALDLLGWLDLEGCCVTGDSNFCARNVIDKIIEGKAHYLLALKGKSPHLFAAVQASFEAPQSEAMATYTTEEQGHGRWEKRVYRSLPVRQLDQRCTESYRHLEQVIEVTRYRRINQSGRESMEVAFYLTSLQEPLELVADKIRRHWSIENQLHWVLDVEFGEDQSRKRQGYLASNMSLVRKIALNLLRRQPDAGSLKAKRMKCAISDEYRDNLFKKS